MRNAPIVNTLIETHAQACACAFLNSFFDYPEDRVPYAVASKITRFSIVESDTAIGRLIGTESPRV